MAVRTLAIATAAVLLHGTAVRGQSATFEVTQSAGYSTEQVAAAATQAKVFGDAWAGIRFTAEAAWGARSESESDVFGAAYPYENRLQVIEAFAERIFQPGPSLFVLRAGRYRTPFGISNGSDHAYTGFLRAPLIRYDDYYALSNNFLEHGLDVVVGTPRASLEVSAGTPGDVGEAQRRHGLDTVVRGQLAGGPLVVGVSYLDTLPYQPEIYAFGRATFTGVDVRWMQAGVQVRSEWITGQPFDGTTTTGGYVDVIVHRPRMGPVTAVARAERLDYQAPAPFALRTHRYTAGARVRMLQALTLQLQLVRQPPQLPSDRSTALDLAITYSIRRH
jgi:hypothetical protein